MGSAQLGATAGPLVRCLLRKANGAVASRIQPAHGVYGSSFPVRLSAGVRRARGFAVRASSESSDAKPAKMDSSTAAQVAVVAQAEGLVKGLEATARGVSVAGELTQKGVVEAMEDKEGDKDNAAATVAFWVGAAVVFGVGIGFAEGPGKASEFFAGYLLEQSLSVDNLFVFVLVFSFFKVPVDYQPRVLSYGIAGAVVFRAIMIFLGITALQSFEAVNLVFAAVLLFSSYKLLTEEEEDEDDLSSNSIVNFCKQLIPVTDYYDGPNFYTSVDGIRMATPLLLSLAVIELSDVFFAFDSIPAIFGVTRDPFIVFTSNIFAILGLRALFTLVSTSLADLRYLQPAIAIILGFIGGKLVADYGGIHVPTEASLSVVAGVLVGAVFLSLRFPKSDQDDSL